MNGREKITAALSATGTPEIPAVMCYEGIYLRDHWKQVSRFPWYSRYSPDLEDQLAWRSEVIAHLGQDWFEIPECQPARQRAAQSIATHDEQVFITDQNTGARREIQPPVISGWPGKTRDNAMHPEVNPSSRVEIDRYLPMPGTFDAAQFIRAGRRDLAAALLSQHGEDHYPIYHVAAPLWGCYRLWSFEEMMVQIASNPTLVRYAAERKLAYGLNEIRKAAALGAAGIWIEDCMVDMISPAAYQELNLPLVQALVDETRAQGMQSVYYYCGSPRGRLELLLATGADALALEESKKGFTIDIQEVARVVDGRCALLGNLDAINLLPDASEVELRAALTYQIEAGRLNNGRFIMSVGSPITPETTHEQVRRYIDLTHALGGGSELDEG